MTLWTGAEAARATGGRTTGPWRATGVSIDTRTLVAGDLFVALKDLRDGHDFVAQAFAKGAAAALVSRIPQDIPDNAPLLIVEDVLAALEELGRAARTRTRAKVIAVTGSVGKTSTKEMLRRVLASFGRTHASDASYNNHWGVPLTLARMPEDTEFAAIEIGMNHPGEIAPLARLTRPHVAIITTVAAAHLAAFGKVEAIAVEKSAILEGLEPGGAAVFNAEVETAGILRDAAKARRARYIGFGAVQGAHHRLLDVNLSKGTTVAHARAWRSEILYKISATGRHFAMNGLSVLGAAHALGLDRALVIAALGRWAPVTGRGHRWTVNLDPAETGLSIDVIDDSYNANPASMAAALAVLAATPVRDDVGRIRAGRRIAYLGDMGELGETAPELHAATAALASMDAIDRIHCIGPLSKHLWSALPASKRGRWQANVADMAQAIHRDLDAGDVVLVKGSNSIGLSALVDEIRKLGHRGLR